MATHSLPVERMSFEQTACWLMAGVCGGGGAYAYATRSSIPSLVAGLTFSALYGLSAYLIHNSI